MAAAAHHSSQEEKKNPHHKQRRPNCRWPNRIGSVVTPRSKNSHLERDMRLSIGGAALGADGAAIAAHRKVSERKVPDSAAKNSLRDALLPARQCAKR